MIMLFLIHMLTCETLIFFNIVFLTLVFSSSSYRYLHLPTFYHVMWMIRQVVATACLSSILKGSVALLRSHPRSSTVQILSPSEDLESLLFESSDGIAVTDETLAAICEAYDIEFMDVKRWRDMEKL